MEQFKDNLIFANLISSYMKSGNEGLFTTRTVGELLWGYEDALLKALKLLKPNLDDVFGLFYKVKYNNACIYIVLFLVLNDALQAGRENNNKN